MFIISLLLGIAGSYLVLRDQMQFSLRSFLPSEVTTGLAVLAVAVALLFWFLPAARVYMLLRWQQIRIRWYQAIWVHFSGWFGTAITPGKAGSGPLIAMMLKRLGLPWGQSIYSALYLAILDIVFFSIALPLSAGYLMVSGIVALSPIVTVVVFGCTLAFPSIAVLFLRHPKRAVGLLYAIAEWPLIRRARKSVRSLARDYFRASLRARNLSGGHWAYLIITTALTWICLYGLLWVVLRIYGVRASFVGTISSLNVITMVANFIPTPGASGYMELAVSASSNHLQSTNAMTAAPLFVWRSFSYYLAFLVGPLSAWGMAHSPRATHGRVFKRQK